LGPAGALLEKYVGAFQALLSFFPHYFGGVFCLLKATEDGGGFTPRDLLEWVVIILRLIVALTRYLVDVLVDYAAKLASLYEKQLLGGDLTTCEWVDDDPLARVIVIAAGLGFSAMFYSGLRAGAAARIRLGLLRFVAEIVLFAWWV